MTNPNVNCAHEVVASGHSDDCFLVLCVFFLSGKEKTPLRKYRKEDLPIK